MKVLMDGFVGRPGSVSSTSHGTSLQRGPLRREEIFWAGRACPDTRSARSDCLGYFLRKHRVEWKRCAVDFTGLWFVNSRLAASRRIYLTVILGGSLVSSGQISVGELTSLLMYTLYVGSGLQMLTYARPTVLVDNRPHMNAFQNFLCKLMFLKISTLLTGASPGIYNARNRRWDAHF
jgi:hypothetical protein